MPCTPTAERLSFTSSSLKGLMIASTFFMDASPAGAGRTRAPRLRQPLVPCKGGLASRDEHSAAAREDVLRRAPRARVSRSEGAERGDSHAKAARPNAERTTPFRHVLPPWLSSCGGATTMPPRRRAETSESLEAHRGAGRGAAYFAGGACLLCTLKRGSVPTRRRRKFSRCRRTTTAAIAADTPTTVVGAPASPAVTCAAGAPTTEATETKREMAKTVANATTATTATGGQRAARTPSAVAT